MILDAQLAGTAQVCVDISSRYLFETAVIERRASGELGPDEFCDLICKAQAETYGDGVDPTTYHPFMWLWKPHYYSMDENFYNYPYAFGQLFGLGLYAIFQKQGSAFVTQYEQLLRDTGIDYAVALSRTIWDQHSRERFLAAIAQRCRAARSSDWKNYSRTRLLEEPICDPLKPGVWAVCGVVFSRMPKKVCSLALSGKCLVLRYKNRECQITSMALSVFATQLQMQSNCI